MARRVWRTSGTLRTGDGRRLAVITEWKDEQTGRLGFRLVAEHVAVLAVARSGAAPLEEGSLVDFTGHAVG